MRPRRSLLQGDVGVSGGVAGEEGQLGEALAVGIAGIGQQLLGLSHILAYQVAALSAEVLTGSGVGDSRRHQTVDRGVAHAQDLADLLTVDGLVDGLTDADVIQDAPSGRRCVFYGYTLVYPKSEAL